MSEIHWQKSSFSAEGNACVNVAVTPDGTLRLCESDQPDTVLNTTPAAFRALIRGVKAGEFACASPEA
ncbi:DUF397 domain-containing protein [Streptomyces xinghaiensis]|uniref:DUF397 domain-containing protein n=1 Tax=Streptomyces xinghaiensis TaxID=1038928 RepID=UPI0034417944